MPVPRRGGGSRSDFGEDWVEEPLDDWFDLRGDSSREQEAAAPDSAAMPAPRVEMFGTASDTAAG